MAQGTVKARATDLSLTTLASLVVLVPSIWFVARPIVSDAVAADIQEEVHKTVQAQTKPLTDAFSVLLERDINRLKRQIAALEYRQRVLDNWTPNDVELLTDIKIELESLMEAQSALEGKDNR